MKKLMIFFYPGEQVQRVRNTHKVADLLERGAVVITKNPEQADVLVVHNINDYNSQHRRDDARHWVVVSTERFSAGINTFVGNTSQAEDQIARLFRVPVPVEQD
jgi:hypothetical protein